jgi:TolB-like protein/Tfp pilus assembly protein PilF
MPEPSLLERLKERKLVQWALAYLAGGLVVLQILDAVAGPLSLSVLAQRAILVSLGFGFVLTLVLAWYHGEKGRQRVSGPELLMIALLLAIAGTGILLLRVDEEVAEPTESASPAAVDDDRPSIAVLPFDNFSPNPDDAYFADGMQEQLVSTLSRIGGLSVRGRTSVMRYREQPKPLPEIADEIGVTFILEGSARMTTDQVVVTAQLIDARRDEHLWSDEYDREFSVRDVISVQRDIAQKVAAAIGALLTPEEEARISAIPTEDSEGYQEYLRGQFQFNQRTEEGIQRAIDHLERSVALDPGFAAAHATLSLCYSWLPLYSGRFKWAQVVHLAEASAEAAIQLDPGLAEAHTSLGVVRMIRDDVVGAEEEFISAITANPSHAEAHYQLSYLLSHLERHEEAIAAGRKALELDPLSFAANISLGYRLLSSRQYDPATRQFKHLLALYDDVPLGWLSLAFAFSLGDSIDSARTAFLRWGELSGIDRSKTEPLASLADGYRREAVRGTLPPEFDSISGLSLYFRSRLAALVGDEEKALDLLDRDGIEVWPGVGPLVMDPILDPLRDHPRFQALMEKYAPDVEH